MGEQNETGKKKSEYDVEELHVGEDDSLYPSRWAGYLAKVSEITHMPAFPDVWHRLSYARGLQFEMIWYYQHGFRCAPVARPVLEVPL